MDTKKNQIRDDIQKTMKKYELKLQRKTELYRDTLKTKENIYEESRRLVENILEVKDESDLEKLELSLTALKILLEDFPITEEEDENSMFYPSLGDPNFGYKIFHKKEFNQYQIPRNSGHVNDLDQLMSSKCSQGVKTSDTQKFLKNFLSPYTPFRSLLVYHGVGVGKTCAAIMIAENYKKQLQEKNKKIYIILPYSIKDNFKRQIIDITKVSQPISKIQKQCTGDTYMTKKFIQKIKKIKDSNGKYDMDEIQRLANKMIDKNYVLLGYEKFVNLISSIEASVLKKNPETRKKKGKELLKTRRELVKKKIREYFSDSLIIIDEAHNITTKDEVFKKGKNQIEDDDEDLELLSVNTNLQGGASLEDNSSEKDSGSFWDVDTDAETLLSSDNVSTLSDKEKYQEKIGKQFPPTIKKVLRSAENIKLVLLTATPMFNTAEEIIDLINLLLINDQRPTLKVKDIFKNGELTPQGKKIFMEKISGYISYLRGENPINFPQKLDPLPSDGLYQKTYPKYDINGDKLGRKIEFLKIIECEMSSVQWQVYQQFFDTRRDEGNYFDTIGLQVCNLVCSEDINLQKKDIFSISNYYGTKGFNNLIESEVQKNSVKLSFKNDTIKDLFSLDKIHHISIKLKKIIEGIERSDGICFVYSQFIWSGIFPLAVALELLGYSNYSGSNLLPKKYQIPKKKVKVLDPKTNQMVERNVKYLIIKGGSSDDFDKYKKNDEINNMDGSLLKVVLGTKAAGEGLNIYHVREVHVMEPWFHLNRLEQIIGRGIRNCSHTNLPAEKRNVSVFLYCVTEPKTAKRPVRETLDMKLYRVAEEKIGKIGKVMEIIKSSSIDCHLNIEGNSFLGNQWNKPIKMLDSRGNERKVVVEDKKFSNVCNYSKNCEIKCYPRNKKLQTDKIDMTTYRKEFSEDNIKNCMEEIRFLFSEHEFHIVFTLKEIKKYLLDKIPNLQDDIIFQSLNLFIKEDYEIFDYQGNPGTIIYRGSKGGDKYYIFQPLKTSEEIPIILRKLRYDTKINKIRLEKLISKKTMKTGLVEEEIDETKIFNRFLKRFEMDTNKSPNSNIITIITKNLEDSKDLKCPKSSAKCIHNLLVEKYFDYYLSKDRRVILELVFTSLVRVLEGDFKSLPSEIKKIQKINFFENGKMKDNILIQGILSLLPFEDSENTIRQSYIRGLIRYLLVTHLEFNRDQNKRLDENYLGYSYALEDKIVFYSWKAGEFQTSDKKDISILSTYKDKLRVEMDNYHDIYGFCEMQSKSQKNLKFKIVEKTKEKGSKKTQEVTGSTCGPAYDLDGHISLLRKLDHVGIVDKLVKKTDKLGKKTDVCEGLEIMMRLWDYFYPKNYFFSYEKCLVWKNKY